MEKHDLLQNSFKKLNDETASSDGGLLVPSATSFSCYKKSKSLVKNEKYFDQLTNSIEDLASKNLQAASITAEEKRKDPEQQNQAMMHKMEEKQNNCEQRATISQLD